MFVCQYLVVKWSHFFCHSKHLCIYIYKNKNQSNVQKKYAKPKLEKAQIAKYIINIYRSHSHYKLNITVCQFHTFIACPLYKVMCFSTPVVEGGRTWKVNSICSIVFTHKVSLWDRTGLRLSLLSLEFSAVAKAVWHHNVFVEVVWAHGAVALYLVQDLVDGEDGRGSLSVGRAAFGTALIGETFTCKYATEVDWRIEGIYCQSVYTPAYKVMMTNGTQFKQFFKYWLLQKKQDCFVNALTVWSY